MHPGTVLLNDFIACGRRSANISNFGPYIVNGQYAQRGAWPWQVMSWSMVHSIVVDHTSVIDGFSRLLIAQGIHCELNTSLCGCVLQRMDY